MDGASDAAAKAEALRLELGGMKFSTLKARAGAAGVVRAPCMPSRRVRSRLRCFAAPAAAGDDRGAEERLARPEGGAGVADHRLRHGRGRARARGRRVDDGEDGRGRPRVAARAAAAGEGGQPTPGGVGEGRRGQRAVVDPAAASLSLDKDELRLVLVEMGWEEKEVTDEAVDEMMAVIDADGSGDVDFEEL